MVSELPFANYPLLKGLSEHLRRGLGITPDSDTFTASFLTTDDLDLSARAMQIRSFRPDRATRCVREKIAQNVAQSIFLKNFEAILKL
jgi:hypothetical protein